MALDPLKGHAALRRGRTSIEGGLYFLTLCTANRRHGLTLQCVAGAIWNELAAMDADSVWLMRTGVLMPDHLHLLVSLGSKLPIERCVQRLKAKTSAQLSDQEGLSWERGFFDHRLRNAEPLRPVFQYIFLNPYRAKLVSPEEKHPHYRCCADDWTWFQTCLRDDQLPEPSWLQ